jgi:hypothetical protein
VFEILSGSGSYEFVAMFVAICLAISIVIRRRGADEVSALKKENYRLRNILADLMLDNAQPKAK